MLNFIFYSLTGALSGLLAGLLGVGGGSIVVPGLALILTRTPIPYSAIMHVAAGTSLAAMILTSTMVVIIQQRNKLIRWSIVRKLLPGLIIGILFGAYIASLLSTRWLKISFGVFLVITALHLFFKRKEDIPERPVNKITQGLIGFSIGGLSGLLGIGGGGLTIPLLLRLGVRAHSATATSAACSLFLSIVGAISFSLTGSHIMHHLPAGSTGYVYWPAAITVALASLFFVPLGTQLAKRLSGFTLTRVFAVFLLLIALDMLLD